MLFIETTPPCKRYHLMGIYFLLYALPLIKQWQGKEKEAVLKLHPFSPVTSQFSQPVIAKKVPIFATKVHCPALYPSQHCTASMMNCLTCSSCKYHHCTVAWPVQFPLSAALLLIVAIKEITPGSRLPPHQIAGENSKSHFSSLLPLSPCLIPMFVFNLFFIFLNIP